MYIKSENTLLFFSHLHRYTCVHSSMLDEHGGGVELGLAELALFGAETFVPVRVHHQRLLGLVLGGTLAARIAVVVRMCH